ncbi:MAG: hypothetical protein Q7P63_10725 [Verrucomicrobiota bacterium JB022]|nr:hypothetical protein [Verrucomicrobiota bacterium JB022]
MTLSSLALALPFAGSEKISSEWAQWLGLAAVGLAIIAVAAAIGALLGGALWLVSERRKRNLLGFVALAAACGALGAIAAGREISARQIQAELDRQHTERVEALLQERIRREQQWEEQQRALAELRKNPVAAAAKRLPQAEQLALKAMEDELIGRLRQLNERVQRSYAEMQGVESQWLQPQALESYRQLRERYRTLRQQSEELADYTYGFGDLYQRKLDELELSEEGRKVGLAQKESILQSGFFLQYQQVRAEEVEVLNLVIDYLDLLVNYPNQWTYNATTQQLDIEDERFASELQYVISQIASRVQQP